MTRDSIEHGVFIKAPVAVVWEIVTKPEHLATWWSDEADIDLRPNGQGSLTFTTTARSHPVVAHLTVSEVRPMELFSFRWSYPDGEAPVEGNSMLVEFTMVPEGDGTRLRVVESGLAALDWSDEQKDEYFGSHARGWSDHFVDAREYGERLAASAS